jgi:hypothetical protein
MSGVFGGGSSMPKIAATQMSTTAAPMEQMSESEKMNKRLAASYLTMDWNKGLPANQLGKKALLGA